MLKKSIVLYNQIVCFLNENNIKFNDNDKLMSISICVVIEILTGELSQNYVNSLTEEGKKYLGWYTEEQIQANAIYKKLANDNILFNPSSDMTLIIAIINIYLQEDYGMLISYYNPISNDDNIFSSLFFDSDENKIIKVKKQYNYILNLTSKEVDTESIIENAICEWYTYGSFLDLSFIDETKLFTKLIELDITPDFTFRQTKDIIDFEKRFSVYKNQKIKEKIIIELNQFEKTKSFKEKIENIQSNFPVYDKEIKEEIKSNLLKNKFYVTDLNGDISPEYWSIVHSVCSLVGSNIRELIPNLLLDFGKLLIKYPNDKSLKSRIIGLKEQYKLDIKDIIE